MLPTESPELAQESSSSRSTPHDAECTPQMLTLGRSDDYVDAIDYRMRQQQEQQLQSSKNDSTARNDSSALKTLCNSSHSWFFPRLLKSGTTSTTSDDKNDASNGTDQYNETGDSSMTNASIISPERKKLHPLQAVCNDASLPYSVLGSDTLPPLSNHNETTTDTTTQHLTITIAQQQQLQQEHDLQKECAFFFRNTDAELSQQPKKHAWKALRRTHRHSELYEYSDAVHVVPPPVLQKYRTRYAQLNHELQSETRRRSSRYDDDSDDDPFLHHESSLQLQQEPPGSEHDYYTRADDTIPTTSAISHIVRTDTVNQSSLFYEANGRLLMRLPRDQVRLLMDPDLEAGILSVEQWRSEKPVAARETVTSCSREVGEDSHGNCQQPPLRYVLTVHDDLYRKTVAEMSPRTTEYFCCNRACCNDEGKADIRIALYLLGILLFILLVNTFAFHEH